MIMELPPMIPKKSPEEEIAEKYDEHIKRLKERVANIKLKQPENIEMKTSTPQLSASVKPFDGKLASSNDGNDKELELINGEWVYKEEQK